MPGLFKAYRKGNVAILNAPGTGFADDKLIYSYVPEIIKYYLGEEPKLKQVETFRCFEKLQRDHVMKILEKWLLNQQMDLVGMVL